MYDRFEKTLMFYKEKGVDGILITGDLQDNRTSVATAISAMEELQDIWLRVFPNNTNMPLLMHRETSIRDNPTAACCAGRNRCPGTAKGHV